MIQSKDNSQHYIWGDQCDSWVLQDTPGLSVKQEKMPPGTSEKLHFHNVANQFFYILKGEALFMINNQSVSVRAGESISILPTVQHYICNDSGEELEFLVISSPTTNNDRIEIESK
ncbi:cupin domain-containing protein [Chryseobacterium paridis]|uniref:Cupin domain-containing protein n=1 Tax=Chryseobacterium paridis TaxID=2800328 RepID=A0ABS1G123_9FLAO|nr:cupin domain-containing protein [Chryseobacterium paridis]MBK1898174.1 cupin domain-containing protein [Chryseobacterium paridis]